MRLSTLTFFSSACIITGVALAFQKQDVALPVVPNVDLQRYQGRWYEIARLPAYFERKCAGDVTAEYSMQSDGTVRVVNSCTDDSGRKKTSRATAKRRDANGPASKLRVRFFWPFSGDYWILDLDPEYRTALVGTPDRRYLWILSRAPALSGETYEQLLTKAKALGFATERVSLTPQSKRNHQSEDPTRRQG
jgi:apolipoprotein D and lipocalin family protein